MPVPLILARTFKEAHAFAKDRLDLRVGHYRVNPSASTIRAVRNTQIYLVPGWKQRSDRFGVQGALRYCRLEVIDVETWEQAPEVPADPRGDLTERQLEVAYRYNALRDLPAESAEETSDAPEEPAPAFVVTAVSDDVEPPQSHTDLVARVLPAAADEPAAGDDGYIEHSAPAEPAEKPKAKRRSRCKDCGTLHYKDEPCPSPEG